MEKPGNRKGLGIMITSQDMHWLISRHNTNLGTGFDSLYRPAGYNPNLKWEQTATYNIGLDYGFLTVAFRDLLTFM